MTIFPLQNLVCAGHVHGSHLVPYLSVAPAAPTAKPEVVEALAVLEHSSNAKS